jgi:hypothetical protein
MSQTHKRRTLQTLSCPHAVQLGCPHATPARSRWLRSTCVLACRCTARFRALLLLLGSIGIAGFCVAGVGFVTSFLSEAQYLLGVIGSLGAFAASVVIAHLGDPYELQRNECRRAAAARTLPPEPVLSQRVTTSVTRSATETLRGPESRPIMH